MATGSGDAPSHPGAGHRARLRDRFLTHGLEKFTDAEVLELLLTLATPRRDCKQQSRDLLASFGSLRAVMDAAPSELARVKGVGEKNVLGVKLVPAVARRYLEDRLTSSPALLGPREAAEHLIMTMLPLRHEVFRVMLLGPSRRVLAMEDLFSGTLTEAAVYPREVARKALEAGAAALLCAHNHPGGVARPSRDDLRLTRQLYFTLQGVGVELVDHLIVAGTEIYSFAENHQLQRLADEFRSLALEE